MSKRIKIPQQLSWNVLHTIGTTAVSCCPRNDAAFDARLEAGTEPSITEPGRELAKPITEPVLVITLPLAEEGTDFCSC